MRKIMVIYDSFFCNTEKIAQSIALAYDYCINSA